MDAPQISILHEETTPPPPRGTKPRVVKLLLSDKKGLGKPSSPSVPAVGRKSALNPPPRPQSEEEVDEEEEEDQLIDDDEPAPSTSISAGTKRKAPLKKPSRPRKTDKQDKEDKKPDGVSFVLRRCSRDHAHC